jgi:hypothetical protein
MIENVRFRSVSSGQVNLTRRQSEETACFLCTAEIAEPLASRQERECHVTTHQPIVEE